mgnify:CR=1 FL=1
MTGGWPRRRRRGQVALFVASAMDQATLRNLRALVDAEVRVALVVDGMREADVLGVVGCGVTAIVWRRAAASARLLRAVRAAHQGEAHVPTDLVGTMVAGMGRRKDAPHARCGGTHTDRDDATGDRRHPAGLRIRLVPEGLDTGAIAVRPSSSERTVTYVLQHLTSRLQLRPRSHAVACALRARYIRVRARSACAHACRRGLPSAAPCSSCVRARSASPSAFGARPARSWCAGQ